MICMASRFEKLVWSILCGTALGLGTTGCYESTDQDMYGPPPDVATDGEEDADEADVLADTPADAEAENVAMYGPAPMYGPEPEP